MTDWPKRMRAVDGRFYWRPSKALLRLGFQNITLGDSAAEAISMAQDLNVRADRELAAARPRSAVGIAMDRELFDARLRAHYKIMFQSAVVRAGQRGTVCDISHTDQIRLIDRAGGACELTGITFDLTTPSRRIRPFAPSLDRISAGGPYTFKNCRIVCTAVNVAMSDWGESVFRAIAAGLLSMDAKRLASREHRKAEMGSAAQTGVENPNDINEAC